MIYSSDEYFEVRANACKALAYISHIKYYELVKTKLYNFIFESSTYAKSTPIYLCKEKFINQELALILETELVKDANYTIKSLATTINTSNSNNLKNLRLFWHFSGTFFTKTYVIILI